MGEKMKFSEVKAALRDSGRIRRTRWVVGQCLAKPSWHCGPCEKLKLSKFSVYTPGASGIIHEGLWRFEKEDMKADDWVVL